MSAATISSRQLQPDRFNPRLEKFVRAFLPDEAEAEKTLDLDQLLCGQPINGLSRNTRKALRRQTKSSKRSFETSCRVLSDFARREGGTSKGIGTQYKKLGLRRGVIPRRYALRLPITHDTDFGESMRGHDMFGIVSVSKPYRPLHMAVLSLICALWEQDASNDPWVDLSPRMAAAFAISDRYEPNADTLSRVRGAIADLASIDITATCRRKSNEENFAITEAPLEQVRFFDGLGTSDASEWTSFHGKPGCARGTVRVKLGDELVRLLRGQRTYVDFETFKTLPDPLTQRVYLMSLAEARSGHESKFYKYLDDKYLFTVGMTTNPTSRTQVDGLTYYKTAEDAADRLEFAFGALVAICQRHQHYHRTVNSSNNLPEFAVTFIGGKQSTVEPEMLQRRKLEIRLYLLENNHRLGALIHKVLKGTKEENAPLAIPPDQLESDDAHRLHVRQQIRASIDAKS